MSQQQKVNKKPVTSSKKGDDEEKITEQKSPQNIPISRMPSTPLIYSKQSSLGDVFGSPALETQQYNIFNPNDYLNGKKLYKYDYTDLHNDLEKQLYCGVYGWDNACYWGIAETKAKTDLTKHYTKRHSVK